MTTNQTYKAIAKLYATLLRFSPQEQDVIFELVTDAQTINADLNNIEIPPPSIRCSEQGVILELMKLIASKFIEDLAQYEIETNPKEKIATDGNTLKFIIHYEPDYKHYGIYLNDIFQVEGNSMVEKYVKGADISEIHEIFLKNKRVRKEK